ncbi:MAG TPA: hypothetical protein ENN67_02430 [Firmicutes bacterium]|nr:hypothetical protein [Bacillota bacterium]
MVKIKGLLRFRDSQAEPREKQTEKKDESLEAMRTETIREMPPFQRAKQGAGDIFLAPEVVPILRVAN